MENFVIGRVRPLLPGRSEKNDPLATRPLKNVLRSIFVSQKRTFRQHRPRGTRDESNPTFINESNRFASTLITGDVYLRLIFRLTGML